MKKKKLNFTIVILLLFCLFIGLMFAKNKDSEKPETKKIYVRNDTVTPEDTETISEADAPEESEAEDTKTFQPVYTTAGIVIEEVKSYAGKYLEDGSDEIVSNVMALLVKNETEKSIQLADLTVTDNMSNTYEFRITTLLPRQELLVLESNRTAYEETVVIESAEVASLALFSEPPSLQEDVFEIQCSNNLITVKNISEETISAARICYKNISGDIYIGGITYTVSIPQLQPGESIQMPSRHYTEDTSEVVFVTYAK